MHEPRRAVRDARGHPGQAVAVREGAGRVLGDEAVGLSPLLFRVQRRLAGHSLEWQRARQGHEAPDQVV